MVVKLFELVLSKPIKPPFSAEGVPDFGMTLPVA
jgi:hypothetical protein